MRLLLILLLATLGVQSDQKHEVREKGNSNAHSPKPISSAPSPSQASANPTNANSTDGANQNKNQSVNIVSVPPKIPIEPARDSFDWIAVGCTAILTIVGIVGTCAAIKTLRAIRIQAHYMRVHAKHFSKLSNQTSELIEQAGKQVNALSTLATATESSADALVAAERAWLMVNIEKIPGHSGGLGYSTEAPGDKETTLVGFRWWCINEGNTPAWLDEIYFRPVYMREDAIPEKPDLTLAKPELEQPQPIAPGKESTKVDIALVCDGHGKDGEILMLYGFVSYRDMFDKQRSTVFGYYYTLDQTPMRYSGKEWNKNT